MEKVIKLGGKEVRLKSTAASLIRYKANFGRDGLKDLISLADGISVKNIGADGAVNKDAAMNMLKGESFDLDVFYRFFWVFAKSGDPSIPPLEEWLDTIDEGPIDTISVAFPAVAELLTSTAQTTVAAKNLTAATAKMAN